MGNSSSSLKNHPQLQISGPLNLSPVSYRPQTDEEEPQQQPQLQQQQDTQPESEKVVERGIRPRSVSHPILSRPEFSPRHTHSHTRKISLPDKPSFLPELPHISLNFDTQESSLFKQIEAHATSASMVDNVHSDIFYSEPINYDIDSGIGREFAAAHLEKEYLYDTSRKLEDETSTQMNPAMKRHCNRTSNPPYKTKLKHKNSTSSMLSFRSIRSKTSLSSLRSRNSEAAFEIVTPPGSADSPNREKKQSIIVTNKTPVQYDNHRGEWQFGVDGAKVVEPELEPKKKRMRILRSFN